MAHANEPEFWDPEFDIQVRDDGTILMRQKHPLDPYLQTLADYLDHWANATPDQTWIARRSAGGDWICISYGEARDRALSIGAALLSLGLRQNNPLLILSENSLEHAILGAACFYVGIPYAPLSPAYSLVSKDHIKLKDIAELLRPGAIFADDGALYSNALSAISTTGRHVLNARNDVEGALNLNTLPTGDVAAARTAREKVSGGHVVKYLFTSGSTGSPKAVINTNKMICAMQAMVRDSYRFLNNTPPVVLDWAPWNHTAAGNKVSYLVLTNGGTYYIDDGRPVAGKFEETLRNLREIACTWYFNVPAGWDMLVEELEKDDALSQTFFSRLDMMFYAGAGMAQHTWDRIRTLGRRATGREVLIATGLGSTETAPYALACTEVQDKSGNVGVPSRELEMKLIPHNKKLEVRLRGPSITPGYYGDPEKTAEVFDDEGYYKMGDALRPADPHDLTKGFFFDGRIAENFKLNTGTWVAVGAVRAALVDAMDGLVRDAVIVGENEAELGALLWLSDSAFGLEAAALRSRLKDGLETASKAATGSASRVRRALVMERPPSFDLGEIAEKGSLNQRVIRANRAAEIAGLYVGGEGVLII